MMYKNYLIEKNDYSNGSAPGVNYLFSNTNDCDEAQGSGSSIEDCQKQIDEILLLRAPENESPLIILKAAALEMIKEAEESNSTYWGGVKHGLKLMVEEIDKEISKQ